MPRQNQTLRPATGRPTAPKIHKMIPMTRPESTDVIGVTFATGLSNVESMPMDGGAYELLASSASLSGSGWASGEGRFVRAGDGQGAVDQSGGQRRWAA